jgi:hypothetical protein
VGFSQSQASNWDSSIDEAGEDPPPPPKVALPVLKEVRLLVHCPVGFYAILSMIDISCSLLVNSCPQNTNVLSPIYMRKCLYFEELLLLLVKKSVLFIFI